jgi:hypothetical protein
MTHAGHGTATAALAYGIPVVSHRTHDLLNLLLLPS